MKKISIFINGQKLYKSLSLCNRKSVVDRVAKKSLRVWTLLAELCVDLVCLAEKRNSELCLYKMLYK